MYPGKEKQTLSVFRFENGSLYGHDAIKVCFFFALFFVGEDTSEYTLLLINGGHFPLSNSFSNCFSVRRSL